MAPGRSLSIFALAALLGSCGDGDECPTCESDDGSCSSEAAPESPWWPSLEEAATPFGTGELTFAVRYIYFGDTTWADEGFTQSDNAWRLFGRDLDRFVSTECSREHCRLLTGAPKSVKVDGPGGMDNSFGRNIIPGLLAGMQPSQVASYRIATGAGTYLLRLSGTDLSHDQKQIRASWYIGGARTEPPKWDGTDVWPVRDDSLDAGNLEQPRVAYDESYFTNGSWVSGWQTSGWSAYKPAVLVLELPIWNPPIRLHLRLPVMAMKVTGGAGTPMRARGIIAGIIDTHRIAIDFATMLATPEVPVLCADWPSDGTSLALRQASDIDLHEPHKSGRPDIDCSGISAGIGFEAELAHIGEVAPGPPEPPIPCLYP